MACRSKCRCVLIGKQVSKLSLVEIRVKMGCGMDACSHLSVVMAENADFLAMYSGWVKNCDTGGRRRTQKWPATASIVVF